MILTSGVWPAVLGRLVAFLPKMRAANDALAKQCASDPTVVDIEYLEDPDDLHIEMVA